MKFTDEQKERIKKLSLFNDYIFAKIMKNTSICKHLIELILEREIDYVEPITYQKSIKVGLDTKAVRLDVYVKDDKEKIYNIEVQVANTKNLEKRARYYGAIIDTDNTYVGEDYSKLKETYIIFITPFDIMGNKEYKYTFKTICMENGKVLEDGLTKIFLNTKSKNRCKNKELRELLAYMEDKSIELKTEYMQNIDRELRLILNNALRGEMDDMEVMSLNQYLNQLYYEQEKARYEKEKARYEKEKAIYEQEKANYEQEKAKYEQKKRELEEDNTELREKISEVLDKKDEDIFKNILTTIDILKSLNLSQEEIEDKIKGKFAITEDKLKKMLKQQ